MLFDLLASGLQRLLQDWHDVVYRVTCRFFPFKVPGHAKRCSTTKGFILKLQGCERGSLIDSKMACNSFANTMGGMVCFSFSLTLSTNFLCFIPFHPELHPCFLKQNSKVELAKQPSIHPQGVHHMSSHWLHPSDIGAKKLLTVTNGNTCNRTTAVLFKTKKAT